MGVTELRGLHQADDVAVFPRVENPSPRLAEEVTARLWPCVELQWNWLGGAPEAPVDDVQLRKAA